MVFHACPGMGTEGEGGMNPDHELIEDWLRHHNGPRPIPLGMSAGADLRLAPKRIAPAVLSDGDWYIVRTATRSEQKVREELELAGFEAYLPEYRIERFNRRFRTNIVSTLYLFPGYLFARQSRVPRWPELRGCPGVSDVLPGFPHVPEAVDARDVEIIRQAQADLVFDDTDEARRHRGHTVKNTLKALKKRLRNKTVRVTDGPFAGFHASVEVVESLERLKVAIDIFGRYTPVELEIGQIEELAA